MSLREFAEFVGVSDRMVSKWEKLGEQTHPHRANQEAFDTVITRSNAATRSRSGYFTGSSPKNRWSRCLLLALLGCESSTAMPACGIPRDASIDAALVDGTDIPTPDACTHPNELCDGTNELRLLYGDKPFGNIVPQSAVLSENGFRVLIVDGVCRFYAKRDEWSGLRTGLLDDAAARALLADLAVDRWPAQATICEPGFDRPGRIFVYGSRVIFKHGCGGGDTLDFDPEPKAIEALEALFEEGTPVDGDVRFTLFRRGNPLPEDEGDIWPLGNPEDFVGPPEDTAEGLRYPVHVAKGEQAEALRQLRSQAAMRGGRRWPQFISIIQPDGSFYELYVRDVGPFEDDNGQLMLDLPKTNFP